MKEKNKTPTRKSFEVVPGDSKPENAITLISAKVFSTDYTALSTKLKSQGITFSHWLRHQIYKELQR